MEALTSVEPVSTADADGLAKAPTIFADSRLALELAWSRGCPRSAEVRTSSPGLRAWLGDAAEPLEAGIDGERLQRLGQDFRALAHALDAALRADAELAEYALTVVRALAEYQRIVYKAMCLRAEDFERPVVTADHDCASALDNARFNSPLSRLLAPNARHRRVAAPVQAVPVLSETRPSFATRLRFEPWPSIVYRLLVACHRALPARLRGTILIYSENSLVKETAAALARRGYALRRLASTPESSRALEPALACRLAGLVAATARPWLGEWVTPGAVAGLLEWLQELALARVQRYAAALAAWPARLEDELRGGRGAVLAGDVPRPETEALYRCCRALGIPFYAFQHGTGVELSTATRHAEYLDEACAADVFFTFNDAVARHIAANPFAAARLHTVGLPADLARVARAPARLRGAPPVFYVSCHLFIGNWQYPASVGVTDHVNCEHEKAIVAEVLARIPHRVLFKPYPSIRYLDPHPVIELARRCPNIDVYSDWIDLRYIVNAARVLIAGHGGSTVSWCLLSGKPLVFIDEPFQTPLRPELRDEFAAAVFFFDARSPRFHADLRSFLAQPLEAIEAAWRDKAGARAGLIERYFGRTDGGAGRRAARFIAAELAK